MKLTVTVSRIKYQDPTGANTWKILATDQGSCLGNIPWIPAEGDALELTGEWEDAGVYGQQFKFSKCLISLPASPRDLLHLVCIQTDGIGPVIEDKIASILGDGWQETLEPDLIPGLSQKLFGKVLETLQNVERNKVCSETLASLMGLGCSETMARKAWEEWKEDTLGKVRANCYILAELPHFGFGHVDKDIRHSFGIGDRDPRRIRAALVYAMEQLTAGGSDVALWHILVGRVEELTGGIYAKEITEISREMFEAGTLRTIGTEQVCLGADYTNSEYIMRWIDGR